MGQDILPLNDINVLLWSPDEWCGQWVNTSQINEIKWTIDDPTDTIEPYWQRLTKFYERNVCKHAVKTVVEKQCLWPDNGKEKTCSGLSPVPAELSN